MSGPFPNDLRTDPSLSESSARAVDALFEGVASKEISDAREQALSRLLALLEPASRPEDAGATRTLIDVVMARLVQRPEQSVVAQVPRETDPSLARESATAFDSFVESGWAQDGGSAPAALVGALDAGLGSDTDSQGRKALVEATLAKVQSQLDADGRRFRLPAPEEAAGPRATGLRLGDLSAVAAILLLGSAIIWPMLSAARDQAQRQMCASNLRGAAMGFTMYASDYADALPQARASFLGGPWWDVGEPRHSHSANLYRLVKQGYASLGDLACPGNSAAVNGRIDPAADDWKAIDEVSFSYQHFGPRRPRWNQGAEVLVLADKSPVVVRARRGEEFDPSASSRNHRGLGQHLLMSDGSLRFEVRPDREGGDNIWLPANLGPDELRLTGRERPADSRDAFVGP